MFFIMANNKRLQYLRDVKLLSESDPDVERKLKELNNKYYDDLYEYNNSTLEPFDMFNSHFGFSKSFFDFQNIMNDFKNNVDNKFVHKFEKLKQVSKSVNGKTVTYKEHTYNDGKDIVKEITHPDGKVEILKNPEKKYRFALNK
jgi:hypothetical protein